MIHVNMSKKNMNGHIIRWAKAGQEKEKKKNNENFQLRIQRQFVRNVIHTHLNRIKFNTFIWIRRKSPCLLFGSSILKRFQHIHIRARTNTHTHTRECTMERAHIHRSIYFVCHTRTKKRSFSRSLCTILSVYRVVCLLFLLLFHFLLSSSAGLQQQ